MIVTSEGNTLDSLAKDPNFSLFRGIAHEIGHYWWNFGAGQGDWISEAFAEYYSAIALQNLSSQKDFNALLEDYRKHVAELPENASSLATVSPSENADFKSIYFVRYYKGSLFLDAIRRTMGDEKFFAACREFYETYKDKPTQTSDFRSFWKSKLGDKANMIDRWLDSPGGLPK